jgi:hypothetical protein
MKRRNEPIAESDNENVNETRDREKDPNADWGDIEVKQDFC